MWNILIELVIWSIGRYAKQANTETIMFKANVRTILTGILLKFILTEKKIEIRYGTWFNNSNATPIIKHFIPESIQALLDKICQKKKLCDNCKWCRKMAANYWEKNKFKYFKIMEIILVVVKKWKRLIELNLFKKSVLFLKQSMNSKLKFFFLHPLL